MKRDYISFLLGSNESSFLPLIARKDVEGDFSLVSLCPLGPYSHCGITTLKLT